MGHLSSLEKQGASQSSNRPRGRKAPMACSGEEHEFHGIRGEPVSIPDHGEVDAGAQGLMGQRPLELNRILAAATCHSALTHDHPALDVVDTHLQWPLFGPPE